MEEGTSVGSDGNSLIPLRLLRCLLHHSIVVISRALDKTLVLDFGSYAQTVNESLLLLNLFLLLLKLQLHRLEFL